MTRFPIGLGTQAPTHCIDILIIASNFMKFKSLDELLRSLQQQESWQRQREPWELLLECWPQVVGAAVAKHTRPVAIHQDVLKVATSSSVWAEELKWKRLLILEKLNAHLPTPLTDIRFSPAQWHTQESVPAEVQVQQSVWGEHPSRVDSSDGKLGKLFRAEETNRVDPKTPQMAFDNWAKKMQARSQSLPLCPSCKCPTPPGELERWSVCAICAARQF